ncbi:MAG: helix-turn-helix transcriptional regulator [Chloroflexi bacterium]|nr:helix-turn-helix transcriptional regulator [Chloroflexota bacterium]
MIAPIDYQVIKKDGEPLFVLVPYEEYLDLTRRELPEPTIPHDVVELHILEGKTLARAWREYLGHSQREVAERTGISQSAYSQMEKEDARLRPSTRQKIAAALGISPEQLRDI